MVDVYFSKEPFVTAICIDKFELTSRFRKEAHLQYENTEEKKNGRGRPKQFDGKADYKNLNESYFK